jgi:hypothetical protein
VNTTAPALVNFNYFGIDSVRFTSFGGTPHYYLKGENFVLDNLVITVPEPSKFVLIGLGIFAWILVPRTKCCPAR